MIKRLVIAEKPSVAMSIAGVLGVNARRDGYLENDAYAETRAESNLIDRYIVENALKCKRVIQKT